MRMTLPGTIRPSSTTGTSLIAPTARIADSGGLMIATNSSTPYIPRLEIEDVPPVRSCSPGRPERARSTTWRDSIEICTRSLRSTSCTTGTSSPRPWLGGTASPMLIERLRWKRPSTHEVLTSGNLRSASAHARMSMSVMVTFSAPGTDSFSCWRNLTASSTRASTVTLKLGTVAFASAIRLAMVACMRVGSMTSTSGPAGAAAPGGGGGFGSFDSRLFGCGLFFGGSLLFGDRRGTGHADAGDRRSDLCRDPLLDQDLEGAVVFGLEVEGRFVRLDLGEHVALVHLVAGGLLPLDDRALLHRVGELGHVYVSHYASTSRLPTVRRTSRLMSSAVGIDAFSSGRLYGIGTCAPPRRRIGASR